MRLGGEMWRWMGLTMAVMCLSAGARAQAPVTTPGPGENQQPVSAQEMALPTLHVYADLVQVTALVMDPNGARLDDVPAASRFSVSIGRGPWFRATHVHLEGNEPLSLSILLDANGDTQKLLEKANETIADLAPELLQASDRVSIYALDCTLVRGLKDVPAERESLRRGVDAALRPWSTRMREGKEGHCKQTVHLRDTLAFMVDQMSSLRGHRVIVAVSNGEDWSSHISWTELKSYAQMYSVTIFGVRFLEPANRPGARSTINLGGANQACAVVRNGSAACSEVALYRNAVEDPFDSVCQLSGGATLATGKGFLWETLMWVTTMLRERYVVEYPRPSNSTPGMHSLDVKVDRGDYLIRPSGVSFAMLNREILNDPTTIAADPTHTPQQGRQRVLPMPK